MSRQSPTRYVVRPATTRHGGARAWWLALGWLVSLLAAALATYALSRPAPVEHQLIPASILDTVPAAARTASLRQQLAQLRQGRSVDRVSARKLQQSLAERDKTINDLRAELAFYTRLTGSARHGQVQIQEVHVAPVPHSTRAWNITLILTRNARGKSEMHGKAKISLQGIRKQHVVQLGWSALAAGQQDQGMAVQFRYFQKLQATLMLPENFTPNQLHVTVIPDKGDTIDRKMTWADALTKPGTADVQQ